MKSSIYKFLIFTLLISLPGLSQAQENSITGKVTTLENIAVVNAEVKVLSSKDVVWTDTEGNFTVNCQVDDKIKVSAKGFKAQKIKIDKNTKDASVNLTFTNSTPTEKNIVQAIGYGYIKEEDRSYAISSTQNTDKNNFMMYSNMIEVIVNSSTSVVYQNGGFVVRGGSSLLGSNTALIIIDGREANMTQLNTLLPAEVKSVDILKGSASSIYGSRGANGVIIVNTKKKLEDI